MKSILHICIYYGILLAMDKSCRPLTERAIRDALVVRLCNNAKRDQVLIEELGVGSARVDLALAADRLEGFEIKSDFDTLDRLARQMHAYHSVFDTLTIVTTSSYANQVEALLPSWWGIWLADEDDVGRVRLHVLRPATPHGRQDAGSMAALLWREEAYAFVTDVLGLVVRPRATRGDLQELIADRIPIDRIRERILDVLRSREVLRSRSHASGQDLAGREDDMVTGCVATPRRQVAG